MEFIQTVAYNKAMTIWLGLFIAAMMAGLLVNYTSDFLMGKRLIEVDPDAFESEANICETCIRPKPLRGYFLFPSRCPSCGKHRGRIFLVYLVMIGLSYWLWIQSKPVDYFAGMVLLVFFGVVFVIDFEHRLILHPVSLTGAGLGLAFGVWQRGFLATLLGGLAGFGIMLGLFLLGGLFAWVMARLRQQSINEVALGFGDVNLAGVLGLMLGWPGIVAGLVFAILLGGLFSLFYLLVKLISRKYQAFAAIPYGPFLVISALFLLFFRDVLLKVWP